MESQPEQPPAKIFTPQVEAQVIPKHRILLAEDNAHNQNIIIRALTKLGHMVDLAVNGEEALNLLGQHSYDSHLMDIHMPVMDGKNGD